MTREYTSQEREMYIFSKVQEPLLKALNTPKNFLPPAIIQKELQTLDRNMPGLCNEDTHPHIKEIIHTHQALHQQAQLYMQARAKLIKALWRFNPADENCND